VPRSDAKERAKELWLNVVDGEECFDWDNTLIKSGKVDRLTCEKVR
jgi:hypothetical protein